MQAHSLFSHEATTFRDIISSYCDKMGYHHLHLSDNELAQLNSYAGENHVTPSARAKDLIGNLHFEVKRGLARRYCFELLLRGDLTAYNEFIQSQDHDSSLVLEDFNKLSEEARSLSNDIQASIKISCFLTMNDSIKETLATYGHVSPNDSEQFISQLIPFLSIDPTLIPITKSATPSQLALLQKMFWPGMHFRHMLYTEGGESMTKTFQMGLTADGFSRQDFLAWKWRWLTNLFGFQIGKGAKYYDGNTYFLTNLVMTELEHMLDDPMHSYLDNYLLKRAEYAGLTDKNLTVPEQNLLGHLAAYYNQIHILTPDLGVMIYAAYRELNQELHNSGELAVVYERHRLDKFTVTPTYVPAIINNAYLIFKNKFGMNVADSIKNSSRFMCQVLLELYTMPNEIRISCMNFAKESTLQLILEKWLHNHYAFNFAVNDASELIAQDLLELNSSLVLAEEESTSTPSLR